MVFFSLTHTVTWICFHLNCVSGCKLKVTFLSSAFLPSAVVLFCTDGVPLTFTISSHLGDETGQGIWTHGGSALSLPLVLLVSWRCWVLWVGGCCFLESHTVVQTPQPQASYCVHSATSWFCQWQACSHAHLLSHLHSPPWSDWLNCLHSTLKSESALDYPLSPAMSVHLSLDSSCHLVSLCQSACL